MFSQRNLYIAAVTPEDVINAKKIQRAYTQPFMGGIMPKGVFFIHRLIFPFTVIEKCRDNAKLYMGVSSHPFQNVS